MSVLSINHKINTPVETDPNGLKAVVDEAKNGQKAIPTEIVLKASDDSSFQQVNDTNGLPVKISGSTMEFFGKSGQSKPTPSQTKVGATFFEIDTATLYMNDGTSWVVI